MIFLMHHLVENVCICRKICCWHRCGTMLRESKMNLSKQHFSSLLLIHMWNFNLKNYHTDYFSSSYVTYLQLQFFLVTSSHNGANNKFSDRCKRFLQDDASEISLSASFNWFLAWRCLLQRNKKCSDDSLSKPHSQIGVSDVPVRWESFFNIVSCNNNRQYDIPMSRFSGKDTLTPTVGINCLV